MSNLKIIIVGGMIGVGKTTLIRNLCNQLKQENKKVSVVYELWEECSDNIFKQKNTYDKFMDTVISLYYENIDSMTTCECEKKKDFLLHKLLTHQTHFLSTRTTKVFSAINAAVEKKVDYLILDRSLYEDIVFTFLNLEKYPKLWESYYNIWQIWEANFAVILKKYETQHFLLDAPFETILQRIQKRGRDFEQGEKVSQYFDELNQNYIEIILSEFNKKDIKNYTLIDTQKISSENLADQIINHYLK